MTWFTEGHPVESPLPRAAYETLGVAAFQDFAPAKQRELEDEIAAPGPPEKWRTVGCAQMSSRAWFEWHVRRGRDPRLARLKRSRRQRLAIATAHGWRCALCGRRIGSVSELHIDHVVPLARGGRDSLCNLQPAHARCNLAKGARL